MLDVYACNFGFSGKLAGGRSASDELLRGLIGREGEGRRRERRSGRRQAGSPTEKRLRWVELAFYFPTYTTPCLAVSEN